jgi:Uma2 family endonuclease
MSAVPKRKLTAAEYLTIEKVAEFKSEFYDGEMFAMSGASRFHNTVKENFIGELFARMKGGPCRTYSSDQRVKVDRTGLYTYPDIVVLCGPGEYDPADEDTLLNPTALIEVLSPSTERYDRTTKFRHYKTIPTLREYVLASQNELLVERFVRQPAGAWVVELYDDPAGEFHLACADVRLPLADIYRDVELTPNALR